MKNRPHTIGEQRLLRQSAAPGSEPVMASGIEAGGLTLPQLLVGAAVIIVGIGVVRFAARKLFGNG